MVQESNLKEILGEENVFCEEPLRKHTTFRIGGNATYYVTPKTVDKFCDVLTYIKEEGTSYFIMGNGSNLLVSDQGFDGVVISTHSITKSGLNEKAGTDALKESAKIAFDLVESFSVDEDEFVRLSEMSDGLKRKSIDGVYQDKVFVLAGAGVMLSALARVVAEKGLAGFEFAGGIPGTLGGAVTMNAGAYGGEMKDCIVGAFVLMPDGKMQFLTTEELELGYRTSVIQKQDMVVLWAVFAFSYGDKETIFQTMKELNQKRRDKQPLEYGSAGSTFKRPEGHFAGKLIEEAGLRGYRIGDIMVSDKHCGFVVNVGDGTCEQANQVIVHVQEEVKKQFGVSLELEVKRM